MEHTTSPPVLEYHYPTRDETSPRHSWLFFWLLLPGVAVPFLPLYDDQSVLQGLELLYRLQPFTPISNYPWWKITGIAWWSGMFFLWLLLPIWRLLIIRFKRLTQQRFPFYILFACAILPNFPAAYFIIKEKSAPTLFPDYLCAGLSAFAIAFFLILALRKPHPQRLAIAALLVPALSHALLVIAVLYGGRIGSAWYLLLWCAIVGSFELLDYAIRPTLRNRN